MEGENTVYDGVDGLAVIESISYETKIAGRGSGMKTKLGDWNNGQHRIEGERRDWDVHSSVTLYFASARCVLETPGITAEREGGVGRRSRRSREEIHMPEGQMGDTRGSVEGREIWRYRRYIAAGGSLG